MTDTTQGALKFSDLRVSENETKHYGSAYATHRASLKDTQSVGFWDKFKNYMQTPGGIMMAVTGFVFLVASATMKLCSVAFPDDFVSLFDLMRFVAATAIFALGVALYVAGVILLPISFLVSLVTLAVKYMMDRADRS